MKNTILGKLKDNEKFKISNRKSGAWYEVIMKISSKEIIYNSLTSGKSYTGTSKTKVFLPIHPDSP